MIKEICIWMIVGHYVCTSRPSILKPQIFRLFGTATKIAKKVHTRTTSNSNFIIAVKRFDILGAPRMTLN